MSSRAFWIVLFALFYGSSYYAMRRTFEYGDTIGPVVAIGGAVFVFGLAAILGVRNRRAAAKTAQQPRAELEQLAEWAAANGWTVQHLGHRGLTDEIERIDFLTDNAGWGHGTTGDQRSGGSDDWTFGGAVGRETACGRLIVIGGFRYEDRRLWAALETEATTSDVTWDLVDDGRVEQSGPTPQLEDGEPIPNLFVGLPPITRLRIIRNQVLLCMPGRLETDTLTSIAERLTALERRLPRRPGASPQR